MTASPADDEIEALVDVLVMTPMSDWIQSIAPVHRAAEQVLASSWLAQLKARIRAETLQQAAEDVPMFEFMLVMDVAAEVAPAQIAGWLRARADDIEREAQP